MNASQIILPHVQAFPDKTAIIFGDRRYSYAERNRLVNRVASGLLALGLRPGQVVSLFLPSLPELIISYLGIVRAGLTVNVVNAMLRRQEVEYILKDCASNAVIVDPSREDIIDQVTAQVPSLKTKTVLGGNGLSWEAV